MLYCIKLQYIHWVGISTLGNLFAYKWDIGGRHRDNITDLFDISRPNAHFKKTHKTIELNKTNEMATEMESITSNILF